MANHLYAVLLLFITSSSLMIMVASSEVCNKDGGGVGDENCSSLQQKKCQGQTLLPGGDCVDQWCNIMCDVKYPHHGASGKCSGFYRRPTGPVCICTFNCL
ncbi:hypothetical protein HN51_004637 [Arachis hypogaea]|uniref:Uncharacterized protein LOC107483850 n=1 Tax=Arachis duranensis TaxID=130453 RepID=A0A6P4D1P4_ARADU|nr:uncharacterized protein LOC107483850 [Arachis duranensis]XP_025692146.1 uncharacterized protein LOC112794267 [Arachis hypogaea]